MSADEKLKAVRKALVRYASDPAMVPMIHDLLDIIDAEDVTTICVGDRVQIKPQYDDTLQVLGMRTTAGTVSAIYQDDNAIIVDLDSGQGVPYRPEELDILGIELPELTQ